MNLFGEAYTLQRLVDQTLHNGLEALHLPKLLHILSNQKCTFLKKPAWDLHSDSCPCSKGTRACDPRMRSCRFLLRRGESTAYLFPGAATNCHELDTGAKGKQCVLDLEETRETQWETGFVSILRSHHSSRKKKDIECVLDCLGHFWPLSSYKYKGRKRNATNKLIYIIAYIHHIVMATNILHLHSLSKVSLPRKQHHTWGTRIRKLHDYITTASAVWCPHLSAPVDFAGHVRTDPATAQQAAGEVEEAIFLSS